MAGCGKDDQSQVLKKKAAEKAKESAVKQVEDVAEASAKKASQELVNFKCDIAGMQTIYFYKNKAKMETPNGESWLLDDYDYVKMNISGTYYLIKYPGEQSDMDLEGMMKTYRNSKITPGVDCELDSVTEAIVTLPNLQIITPDELQDKMMAMMTEQMGAGLT
ncbi:hypothetical protein COV93_05465 [Candidatus Woesearchaeota archaeon CG11_big_fil_rev_8_21_14_0_20_43_8]|nr:MAG: hypothetical protein COV93_05465 [Candidatus Woesearchaeota archaeon CG11_big_fil_rev_8_21_14_0_20_43_8]PIO08780.1 MAG: hypothetical protein COT47_01125 [Candidatus Woesearchaeota archaeon CG08_land_8_20_14_0_20_43_7]